MKQRLFNTTTIIIIIFIGLFSVLLFSCHNNTEIKAENKNCIDSTFVDKIELKAIEQKKIQQKLHLTGRVEANPDAVVPFMSMVGGQIIKIGRASCRERV